MNDEQSCLDDAISDEITPETRDVASGKGGYPAVDDEQSRLDDAVPEEITPEARVGTPHVAIYARVSSDGPTQTTSCEIQKTYYDEFVSRHPNWTQVKI